MENNTRNRSKYTKKRRIRRAKKSKDGTKEAQAKRN